jgi:hypothetical protein
MWPDRRAGGALAARFVLAALADGLGAQGNRSGGKHMELVLGTCVICQPEILAQQRLDRATWRPSSIMITYSAPIAETKPLIAVPDAAPGALRLSRRQRPHPPRTEHAP